jgi:hypothetical protein
MLIIRSFLYKKLCLFELFEFILSCNLSLHHLCPLLRISNDLRPDPRDLCHIEPERLFSPAIFQLVEKDYPLVG